MLNEFLKVFTISILLRLSSVIVVSKFTTFQNMHATDTHLYLKETDIFLNLQTPKATDYCVKKLCISLF